MFFLTSVQEFNTFCCGEEEVDARDQVKLLICEISLIFFSSCFGFPATRFQERQKHTEN